MNSRETSLTYLSALEGSLTGKILTNFTFILPWRLGPVDVLSVQKLFFFFIQYSTSAFTIRASFPRKKQKFSSISDMKMWISSDTSKSDFIPDSKLILTACVSVHFSNNKIFKSLELLSRCFASFISLIHVQHFLYTMVKKNQNGGG